jgi:hypothetical protein
MDPVPEAHMTRLVTGEVELIGPGEPVRVPVRRQERDKYHVASGDRLPGHVDRRADEIGQSRLSRAVEPEDLLDRARKQPRFRVQPGQLPGWVSSARTPFEISPAVVSCPASTSR